MINKNRNIVEKNLRNNLRAHILEILVYMHILDAKFRILSIEIPFTLHQ